MVVDAGGATVDISTYAIKSGVKLAMQETTTPECRHFPDARSCIYHALTMIVLGLFQGSAIVSFRAREFLSSERLDR